MNESHTGVWLPRVYGTIHSCSKCAHEHTTRSPICPACRASMINSGGKIDYDQPPFLSSEQPAA